MKFLQPHFLLFEISVLPVQQPDAWASNCIRVSDFLLANARLRSKLPPTFRELLLCVRLMLHQTDVAIIARQTCCVRMM